jgi:hypothetical protein
LREQVEAEITDRQTGLLEQAQKERDAEREKKKGEKQLEELRE